MSNTKNILLSAIVICALIIAGIGGTLAGYSDSEESFDNYIVTGSLDLKVDGEDDLPWGNGVPAVINLTKVMPCKWYEVDVIVQNMGEAYEPDQETPEPAHLYLQFKEFFCDNNKPIHLGVDASQVDLPDGYEFLWDADGNPDTPDLSSALKPEPEMVAEYGGWVGQVEVTGLGQQGETCNLDDMIEIVINYRGTLFGPYKMSELVQTQLYLGELPPCGEEYTITFKIHMKQLEDPDWEAKGIEEIFKDWPTNAYMVDSINFGILFELLQEKWVEPT
jgi:predicted ribosomally synthesized peptide with SipW-like signal peptide